MKTDANHSADDNPYRAPEAVDESAPVIKEPIGATIGPYNLIVGGVSALMTLLILLICVINGIQ